jgi:hypothetical protein
MNIIWKSCIAQMDMTRNNLVKVAEASSLLGSTESVILNADNLSVASTLSSNTKAQETTHAHSQQLSGIYANSHIT